MSLSATPRNFAFGAHLFAIRSCTADRHLRAMACGRAGLPHGPWRRFRLGTAIASGCAIAALMPAHAQAATAAYSANQENGTVSVIDLVRDEVVRTIPASGKLGEKIQGIAVDANEKTLFVVDAAGNALVVVDVASGAVRERVAVGHSPEGVGLAPSGKTLAVCVEDDNLVTLIDAKTFKVTGRIPTQGKNPEHCVFSPDEHWLLTSNENSDNVDIIDFAKGKSIALVPTSGHPRGIAFLHKQPIAYVVQETAGGVDVLDLRARKVTATIHTGLRPAGAVASPDDRRVFVTNGGDANVAVIDTADNKVAATVAVGKRAWNMALTPDAKKLYVANGRSNSVSVIDTQTLKPIKEVAVGGLPWGVAIATH